MDGAGRQFIGAGWYIHHLSDRVIELRKDDPSYRIALGKMPGGMNLLRGGEAFVRTRGEPGADRKQIIADALDMARRNDEKLGIIIAKQMGIPKSQIADYTGKQLRLVNTFTTGQEPELIGAKRA